MIYEIRLGKETIRTLTLTMQFLPMFSPAASNEGDKRRGRL